MFFLNKFVGNVKSVSVLIYFMCSIISCIKVESKKTPITQVEFIPEVHSNSILFKADSFAKTGDLDLAKYLYNKTLDSSSTIANQYCLVKIAEIVYFNNLIIDSQAITNNLITLYETIALTNNSQSPLLPLIAFYLGRSKDKLKCDSSSNLNNYSKAFKDYICKSLLFTNGEYYKSISFQLDSSIKYFTEYQLSRPECKSYNEDYWSNYRLSQLYIYKRDHLTSVSYINQLLQDPRTNKVSLLKYNLLIQKSEILYRFDYFKQAEDTILNNLEAITNSKCSKVFQKAIKTLMVIYINNHNNLEFNKYRMLLQEVIRNSKIDYVNINKIIGRYFFENNQHDSAIIFQEKALEYSLMNEINDVASLSTLCYTYSESLEKLGQTQKAIKVFLKSTQIKINNNFEINKIITKGNLSNDYYYVILTRLASIYLSEYKFYKSNKSLINSNTLAILADSLIQKYLIESNEDKKISFVQENKFIIDILKEICLIKFNKTKDQMHLFKYISYFERNKLLTNSYFNMNLNNTDSTFSLNQIKLKSKEFLLKYVHTDKYANQWKSLDFDQYNRTLESSAKANLVNNDPFKNKVESKMKKDSSVIIIFDKIDSNILCITWQIGLFSLYKLSQSFYKQQNSNFHQKSNFIHYPKGILSKSIKSINKILVVQDPLLFEMNVEVFPLNLISDSQSINKFVIDDFLVLYLNCISDYGEKQFNTNKVSSVTSCFWTNKKTITIPLSMPELPGCIKEQEFILNYFPSANIFSGADLNIKNIKNIFKNKHCDVFHLSTHVSSNIDVRDDIKIFLRKGENKFDSLYAFELINQFSNIKNAVLIGCETGIGKNLPNQSSFTLSDYFLRSGTSFVISTTKKISDLQASKFTYKFYKDLAYLPFQQAYRKTKIELINESNSNKQTEVLNNIRLMY